MNKLCDTPFSLPPRIGSEEKRKLPEHWQDGNTIRYLPEKGNCVFDTATEKRSTLEPNEPLQFMQLSHPTYHRLLAGIWLGLIAGLYLLFLSTDLNAREVLAGLFTLFTVSWWGVGFFLLLYIVRPLTLLPMSIFSVMSGVFFGFWLGAAVVYCGIIVSALISYAVGRWLRYSILALSAPPVSDKLLRRRPFEVITGLHLTMLPFDVINYGAGLVQIPWRPFLGGVLIGMIPGTISLTALGAGVNLEMVLAGDISWSLFDWRYISLSATLFTVTLFASYYWRRRSSSLRTPTN